MNVYEDIRKTMKKMKLAKESEKIAIDNTMYHYKRRYCIDCKFLDKKDYSCTKKRILRICLKDYLKNKE